MPELQSRHFTIETLAEGVWAAIALDGGAAIGNCGIVDLGHQTALFDTTLTLQAALDLRAAAEELNGRPVAWVVNSHYHNDHSWGNLIFGDAPTICSAGTRQLMATDGLAEYQWNLAHAAGELAALQQQAQTASAEKDRDLPLWLGYYQGLVDDLPRLIVRLPELTFDQRATLYGDRRSAELITFTGAHTGSDTVLYLPQDGIVFTGDLLFVGCHPFLGDGDPVKLLEALRQIGAWQAKTFVPGHGPVGGVNDLDLLSQYAQQMLEIAGMLVVESGEAYAAKIDALPIPEPYRQWRMTRFFHANVRGLCQRMMASQRGKG